MQPDVLAELIVGTIAKAIAPLRADLARVEGELAQLRERGAAVDRLDDTLTAVRERVAGLEARPPVPGPPGANGLDGLDGKAGADGLGFDDMTASFDGERTVVLRWRRGELVKSLPVELPIPRYQGAYASARSYRPGDVVSYDGSAWHCEVMTSSRPGDASRAWQLMVKKGRDVSGDARRAALAAAGGAS
jgi:integrin beta 3